MKKIVLYLIILIAAGFSSCKEQYSVYEEYIIPDNGIVYPQKADSLKIYPGINRVKLTWLRAKDPKVVKARIYWNNYTDSLNVDNIPTDKDTVSIIINDLPEGTYTFNVKTYDAKGNVSVPTEVTGTVYGVNYIMTLSSRRLNMNVYNDRVDLIWGAVASTVNSVLIRYVTSSDQTVERNISLTETQTTLTDYKQGGEITVITTHLPSPTALDPVVLTDERTFPIIYELNKSKWTIVVSDSLFRADTPGGIAIIDNNMETMWHSNLSVPYPHWFVIDMKEEKVIAKLKICQNPLYVYTLTFEVTFSSNNIDWSAPLNLPGYGYDNPLAEYQIETPVTARYIRITTTVPNYAHPYIGTGSAMIMELYVYGSDV
jgi:hypothetical protein